MAVFRPVYDYYMKEMQQAMKRMKRDRQIIKMVHQMMKTTSLTENQKFKLDNLIKDVK